MVSRRFSLKPIQWISEAERLGEGTTLWRMFHRVPRGAKMAKNRRFVFSAEDHVLKLIRYLGNLSRILVHLGLRNSYFFILDHRNVLIIPVTIIFREGMKAFFQVTGDWLSLDSAESWSGFLPTNMVGEKTIQTYGALGVESQCFVQKIILEVTWQVQKGPRHRHFREGTQWIFYPLVVAAICSYRKSPF